MSTIDDLVRAQVESIAQQLAPAIIRAVRAQLQAGGAPEVSLLRLEDAAKRLAVSTRTLYTMAARGEVVMVGQGRSRRVRADSIERWIREKSK